MSLVSFQQAKSGLLSRWWQKYKKRTKMCVCFLKPLLLLCGPKQVMAPSPASVREGPSEVNGYRQAWETGPVSAIDLHQLGTIQMCLGTIHPNDTYKIRKCTDVFSLELIPPAKLWGICLISPNAAQLSLHCTLLWRKYVISACK